MIIIREDGEEAGVWKREKKRWEFGRGQGHSIRQEQRSPKGVRFRGGRFQEAVGFGRLSESAPASLAVGLEALGCESHPQQPARQSLRSHSRARLQIAREIVIWRGDRSERGK